MAGTQSISSQDNAALIAQLNKRTTQDDKAQEINDRFLKLLVAQMNNQDPLNPLDNAQVTTQMAQINTVTGINNLNQTVASLMQQFAGLQTLQAAQLTGRNVLVSGDSLALSEGATAAVGGVDLPAAVDRVTVEITDANGQVVRTLTLGAQAAGLQTFDWDGRDNAGNPLAAGRYRFSAKAGGADTQVAVGTLAAARVEGVRGSGDALQIILSGIGPVAYADIKQIL